MSDATNSHKSVSKTYRVRKDVLEEIDKRAKEYGISSNQLVNQWLIKCMYLEPLWKHLDAVTIGQKTLSALIMSADENEIEKVGDDLGRVIANQLFTLYHVKPCWTSLAHAFEEVYSKNCNWFRFKHHTTGDTHNLIFIHDLGYKWSIFLKSYIGTTIKILLKVEATPEIDEQMVKFTAKDQNY